MNYTITYKVINKILPNNEGRGGLSEIEYNRPNALEVTGKGKVSDHGPRPSYSFHPVDSWLSCYGDFLLLI